MATPNHATPNHATPNHATHDPAAGTRPAGPAGGFLDVRGLKVHVERAGPGSAETDGTAGRRPPLLLMHGFVASTFTWRAVTPSLARRRTVVAYDRPAFGYTSRPLPGEWDPSAWPDGTPYGPEAQTELAVAVLDALGLGSAVLVGNSMGGAVAALTAVRFPERVAGLVLVDAAIMSGAPPDWTRPLLEHLPLGFVGPAFAGALRSSIGPGLRHLYHDPALVTADVVEGYLRPLRHRRAGRALWELTRAGGSPRLAEDIRTVRTPTLVIGGADDPLVRPAQNRAIARRIPGAELHLIEACGHMPQEECPQRFLGLLEGFLDRIPGAL